MEIIQVYLHIKRNFKGILLSGIVFALFGLFVYKVTPRTFKATGTFFIGREVEDKQEFTYEGYYAQQNALNYSKNVVALLKSKDIRSKALKLLDVPVNSNNLRRVSRMIQIKSEGTQLVTLSAKGETPQQAENLWGAMANELTQSADSINKISDPKIKIISVVTKPVVEESYSNKYLNISIGFLVGILMGTFISAAFDYIKENTRDENSKGSKK